jgi:hypothetical protein
MMCDPMESGKENLNTGNKAKPYDKNGSGWFFGNPVRANSGSAEHNKASTGSRFDEDICSPGRDWALRQVF